MTTKLDIDKDGKLIEKEILAEREYCKDYHFENDALDQLFFLRFLKSGINPTLDNLIDYLSSKHIIVDEIKNADGGNFFVVNGLSLSPLQQYDVKNDTEFFKTNSALSSLQRDVFSYNGIMQIAGPIGAGKSSLPNQLKVRSDVKIYNEIRPNKFIQGFKEDELYLDLLYAMPSEFFGLFNISKPHVQRELCLLGVKELKQGTFKGVIIYDRTREENFRFLELAEILKYASKDDLTICTEIGTQSIKEVDVSESTVLRLLKTPEGCQKQIAERGRSSETTDTAVSDEKNIALYLAKEELLKAAEFYNPIVTNLSITGEKDLRKRYGKNIYTETKYSQIVPIGVDLAYSQNLEKAYNKFLNDFVRTGFKGIIVNLDVENWVRINNTAQDMKISDIATMVQVMLHMKGGCQLEYDDKRSRIHLPFRSTSRNIVISYKNSF